MAEAANHSPLPRPIVATVAFVSGFCIMTVEMLGARIMAPYFGGSVSVWGSIITVFMLALALGYLMGGRLSMRNPNALIFAGFYVSAALFSLPIILFADQIMRPIFLTVEDIRYGALLASIVMFSVPTTLLGMISPYSVRLLVESEEHSGQMAGLLFFVSTIGSAAGTLGTSFYFVLWWELNLILWGAVGALLIAAAIILLAGYLRGSLMIPMRSHET